MDRNRQSLKAGVVGLNRAEQRRVRGGKTVMPFRSALQQYRYDVTFCFGSRADARRNLLWNLPYYMGSR